MFVEQLRFGCGGCGARHGFPEYLSLLWYADLDRAVGHARVTSHIGRAVRLQMLRGADVFSAIVLHTLVKARRRPRRNTGSIAQAATKETQPEEPGPEEKAEMGQTIAPSHVKRFERRVVGPEPRFDLLSEPPLTHAHASIADDPWVWEARQE